MFLYWFPYSICLFWTEGLELALATKRCIPTWRSLNISIGFHIRFHNPEQCLYNGCYCFFDSHSRMCFWKKSKTKNKSKNGIACKLLKWFYIPYCFLIFWFFGFFNVQQNFNSYTSILCFLQKIKKPKTLVISIGCRPIYFCFLILNQ